jgi:hypothetical protein
MSDPTRSDPTRSDPTQSHPTQPEPAAGSGDTHFIDEVAHPASRERSGTLSAGRTILLLLVALLTGALFDSHALLRAGEGMSAGWTRSATLTVARPLDHAATHAGLDRPRREFDSVLHRQTNDGGAIIGSDVPPPLPSSSPTASQPGSGTVSSAHPTGSGPSSSPQASPSAPPTFTGDGTVQLRQPTRADPLKVLVVGDSLSTYVELQMDQLSHHAGLLQIKGTHADGTGLANPAFYNWQKEAGLESQAHHPEVVVMVLGGNERMNMKTPSGQRVYVGTDAWVDEYARRVVAVMQTYLNGGAKVIYWSGPPTARDAGWNSLYRSVNSAVERAALAVPHARYVDLYHGTAVNGHYADRVPFDGHVIADARQGDGIHWTVAGSQLPASLELAALSTDLGRPVS